MGAYSKRQITKTKYRISCGSLKGSMVFRASNGNVTTLWAGVEFSRLKVTKQKKKERKGRRKRRKKRRTLAHTQYTQQTQRQQDAKNKGWERKIEEKEAHAIAGRERDRVFTEVLGYRRYLQNRIQFLLQGKVYFIRFISFSKVYGNLVNVLVKIFFPANVLIKSWRS